LHEVMASNECVSFGGLKRVRHCTKEIGGQALHIQVAAPLKKGPPRKVVYILDPEPELFVLMSTALYGRVGYYPEDPVTGEDHPMCQKSLEQGTDLCVLRDAALVGVGFDPRSYELGAEGWNTEKLVELRRKWFKEHPDVWVGILSSSELHGVAEREMLGIADQQIPRECRAIMGFSLSGVVAAKVVFNPSGRFGVAVLNEPAIPVCSKRKSLDLQDRMSELQKMDALRRELLCPLVDSRESEVVQHKTKVYFHVGAGSLKKHQDKEDQIPFQVSKFAEELRLVISAEGNVVVDFSVPGDHSTFKPACVQAVLDKLSCEWRLRQ